MTAREIRSLLEFWDIKFPECFYKCRKQLPGSIRWYNITTGELIVLENNLTILYDTTLPCFKTVDPTCRLSPQNIWPQKSGEISASEFMTLPDSNHYYQTIEPWPDAVSWYNISNGSMLVLLRDKPLHYLTEPPFTSFALVHAHKPFVPLDIWPDLYYLKSQ